MGNAAKGRAVTYQPRDERDEVPAIEVRVFRRGELVQQEWCESEDQAALVVDTWSEVDGVECEVDDLSTRHRAGDIHEPAPPEAPDDHDDYPEAAGLEALRRRYT